MMKLNLLAACIMAAVLALAVLGVSADEEIGSLLLSITPTQDLTFTTSEGDDGLEVALPPGWTTREGSDGRKVALPPGWTTSEGSDGRKVAYPPGWRTGEGGNGRKIAYPPDDLDSPIDLRFSRADSLALFIALQEELAEDERFNHFLYALLNSEGHWQD